MLSGFNMVPETVNISNIKNRQLKILEDRKMKQMQCVKLSHIISKDRVLSLSSARKKLYIIVMVTRINIMVNCNASFE